MKPLDSNQLFITRAFGSTRTVWLIGRFAFKVPVFVEWRLFLSGLLANMQERQFGSCGYKGIAPVVFALPLGALVVMQRARVMTLKEFYESDFDFKVFTDREDYVIPAEAKPDSFGWINGQVFCIDYGN